MPIRGVNFFNTAFAPSAPTGILTLVVRRFAGYRLPVNFPTGNLGRLETADRVVEPFWGEGRGLGQAT